MWLFQKLALNLLQEKAAVLFVTWLFALSPGVILFAAQAKHYALDILVSTLLLWLASITFFSPVSALRLVWLALAVTIAPWFSLSAIFTVGPMLILMFLKAKVPVWRRLALCLPAGISCLLVVFMVLSRSLSPGQSQIASVFPVITRTMTSIPGLLGTFSGLLFFGYLGINFQPYISVPLPFFGNEVSIAYKILALLCSLGTIISFKRYGWGLAVLLAGPMAVACFLVMLKFYPIHGRAFLFATPGLYLLAGFGLSFLRKRIPYRKPLCLLLVLLVAVPCSSFWRYYSHPIGGVRDALKFISHHHKPGVMVFCDPHSASTVACYQALKNPDATGLHYINRMEDWIEGKINLNQVSLNSLFIPYDYHTLWLLAETQGYTRSTNDNLSYFANSVFHYLENSRKVDFSYITPMVRAIEFSPASKKCTL